jgi:hypothetical protein
MWVPLMRFRAGNSGRFLKVRSRISGSIKMQYTFLSAEVSLDFSRTTWFLRVLIKRYIKTAKFVLRIKNFLWNDRRQEESNTLTFITQTWLVYGDVYTNIKLQIFSWYLFPVITDLTEKTQRYKTYSVFLTVARAVLAMLQVLKYIFFASDSNHIYFFKLQSKLLHS